MLIIYTASPIHDGKDVFMEGISDALKECVSYSYRELDPDIFGDELSNPAYKDIERIAAVGLVAKAA